MPPTATRTSWDERLHRAAELAEKHPFAVEVLSFYREIASFQRAFGDYLDSCDYVAVGSASRLPEELDTFVVLPKLQPFLHLVQKAAPKQLSDSAIELEGYGPERWSALLSDSWRHRGMAVPVPAEQFVIQAFLQPVAEYLAGRADFESGPNYSQAMCPFCGRKPVLGVLRPEGEGAKRSLICSLCSTEWQFRRILCPGCGETEVDKLPVFTADDFEHVRAECCTSCMRFIKTVDLTKQGRANPIVDELASLPLTLWARQKGYMKLESNLFGL